MDADASRRDLELPRVLVWFAVLVSAGEGLGSQVLLPADSSGAAASCLQGAEEGLLPEGSQVVPGSCLPGFCISESKEDMWGWVPF